MMFRQECADGPVTILEHERLRKKREYEGNARHF